MIESGVPVIQYCTVCIKFLEKWKTSISDPKYSILILNLY